ncbi:MAG: cupin domain-containing protein [Candidatus Hydrogenedentes bacterium]|nr:cupin domain-containing protein [Candidatus Hydrogenedentota bacterium]
MEEKPIHFEDMVAAVEMPTDGILSRTLVNTAAAKVVLFAFSTGQELSEHTAAMAATLHILKGEADVILGEDIHHASAGFWAHMPPHLKHSVRTKTPTVMLLVLLKKSA